MKRIIVLLLVLAMAFLLCSCNDSKARWKPGDTVTFGSYP